MFEKRMRLMFQSLPLLCVQTAVLSDKYFPLKILLLVYNFGCDFSVYDYTVLVP